MSLATPSLKTESKPDHGTALTQNGNKDIARSGTDITSLSGSDDEDATANAGVKAIEAISQAWTGWWLIVAYIGLVTLTSVQSLEQATTINLQRFATSSFQQLSFLSTVAVVQSVMLSVVKPPMAKLSDVVGRLEAFSISVFLYTLGYIQQAASTSIETYAGAQVFYAAGQTGVQILVQIFVADTTDLLWRAFFSTVPDIPFLWTTWVGPIVAGELAPGRWRWGYGMWAIALPISFLPLFLALFLNQRKAKRLGYFPISPYKGKGFVEVIKRLWFDLDFFGLLLITAFVSLLLIPLTIGPSAGWNNPSIIAMIAVGGGCLIVFPFWERSKKLAPKAFFPRDIFRNRTVMVGVAIAFFYFMAFYLSVFPYFSTYLQITDEQSTAAAGHITQTFTFTSTVTSLVLSIIIKYTAHYKYYLTFGACIYTLGIGLMIAYRHEGVSVGTLVGCQIAIGIGGGMVNVPAQLGVQASVSHQEVAAATAIYLTILEIGGAVGAAISGAIWSSNILKKLNLYLPLETKNQAADIYADITVAADYIKWPVGSPTRVAINRTYNETMHTILVVGVCIAALLIPLSLFMKNYKLDQIDQKVKGRVVGGQTKSDGRPEVERDGAESPGNLGDISKVKSRWP